MAQPPVEPIPKKIYSRTFAPWTSLQRIWFFAHSGGCFLAASRVMFRCKGTNVPVYDYLLAVIKWLTEHNYKQRRKRRIFRSRRSDYSAVVVIVLILALSLPTAAAAPAPAPLRIASIGQPFAGTTAGSLALAISCIQQGTRIKAWWYWMLYTLWAFSTVSVVAFNCFWVTPKMRIEYLCLFVVTEGISLAVLVAASASALDEIPKRLETWSPIITVLCAGGPTLAFDRHNPGAERTEQDSGTGYGGDEERSIVGD